MVVGFGIYLFQSFIMFQPDGLKQRYVYQFDQPFEEHFIETEDGVTLNALLFSASEPSKGLILYFHGNADNMTRWGQYAVDFTSNGYDVLMIDYRGYGKSTGKASEKGLYKDGVATLKWAKSNLKFDKLYFYGRSLGAAVASNLAIKNTPDLLILETPFDDVTGTLSDAIKPAKLTYKLKYSFPNKEHIPQVNCKIVIFQGTKDRIVPLSSALRLKPLLKEGDEFFIIEKGRHRNLRKFEVYQEKLKTVLE